MSKGQLNLRLVVGQKRVGSAHGKISSARSCWEYKVVDRHYSVACIES